MYTKNAIFKILYNTDSVTWRIIFLQLSKGLTALVHILKGEIFLDEMVLYVLNFNSNSVKLFKIAFFLRIAFLSFYSQVLLQFFGARQLRNQNDQCSVLALL